MIFTNFCNEFNASLSKEKTILLSDELKRIFKSSNGAVEFLQRFAGNTFKDGLYRIHNVDEIDKWNNIVNGTFPEFADFIICFAYDWLGRHFALDLRRKENNEPLIIMLEPGTGEALEIPTTFMTFHEEELIEYQDSALAADFFKEWKAKNEEILLSNQCVGYRIPLFLGGKDSIENLVLSDMEVYWETCGQLRNKARDLSIGTPIKVTIS